MKKSILVSAMVVLTIIMLFEAGYSGEVCYREEAETNKWYHTTYPVASGCSNANAWNNAACGAIGNCSGNFLYTSTADRCNNWNFTGNKVVADMRVFTTIPMGIATFYIDGVNYTSINLDLNGNTFWNFTIADNLTDGFHILTIRPQGLAKETAIDELYFCNITTDVFNTSITITSPTNSTYSTNAVYLNFTATNTNITNFTCYEYVNGVEYALGTIVNNTPHSTYYSDLSSGLNYVYVKCEASDGNYSNSPYTYFYIDNPPIVDILSVNTDYAFNNSDIEIQGKVTDDISGTLTCFFTIDTAVYSGFSALNNLSFVKAYGGLADGDHTITLNCSDSVGSSAIDTYNFSIGEGSMTICVYTYDDYRDWITNSSMTLGSKPNALRDIVIFNDTLGKIWAKQAFKVLSPNYIYSPLTDGCAVLTLSGEGNYEVYLSDNTNFINDKPQISNPRYYEEVGLFKITPESNITENRFISFEDHVSNTVKGQSLIQDVRDFMFMVILFVAVVAGAYLGAMSGSGLATLAIIGFLLAIVMLFKDYILSGGII